MDLKTILDLKTKFVIENQSEPDTLYLFRSDETILIEDLLKDNSPTPKDDRSKIFVEGISAAQIFLERLLEVRVIVDYTGEDGTHFE